MLRCPYCGHEQPIAAPTRHVREHSYDAFLAKPRVQAIAPNQFTCPGCGARTESDAISKDCQFCGTALVAGSTGDEIAPEAVLPFALDKGAARDALRTWTRSRWFAPNRLKKVTEAESMKSTYLPHWTFDASTFSHYSGQRGVHYWVTETYTDNGQTKTRRVRKTRWYPASGSVTRAFDDVLVSATARVPMERLDALEPWPLERAVAFEPGFVAQPPQPALRRRTRGGPGERQGQDGRGDRRRLQARHRRRRAAPAQRRHPLRGRHVQAGAAAGLGRLLPVWRQAVPGAGQRGGRRGAGRSPVQRREDHPGGAGGGGAGRARRLAVRDAVTGFHLGGHRTLA
ncbi:hypothetical protein ACFSTC_49355 [Nonomuraea ferruginea]